MSIQFRSRIKSSIDYSTVLNSKGTCCDKDGNKTSKAFIDCFNDGGNYFPYPLQDVNCPSSSSDVGCCCSCAYVDDITSLSYPWDFTTNLPANGSPYLQSGVVCNIPRCECTRIGGKFTPSNEESVTLTNENWSTYCLKDVSSIFGPNKQIDARYPRSCCSIQQDQVNESFGDVVCTNVCNANECGAYGSVDYSSVFNENTVCGNNLYIDNGTAGGLQQCTAPLKLSQMTQKNTNYKDSVFGSCYELIKNESLAYEYQCTIKPKSLCNGYWKESYDPQHPFCNDKFTPPTELIRVGNSYRPQSLTQTQFNKLNLQIGSEYQGGIYIGVFEPGNPMNPLGSKLYGNMNFGNPLEYYADQIGIGGTDKKWALIVSSKIHNFKYHNDEEKIYKETSLWDGYFNKSVAANSKLYTTFRNRPIDGFIDYYIPSIQELHFYMNYLSTRENNLSATVMSSSIFSTKYISNQSNKVNINNSMMLYGVVLEKKNNINFSRNHTILIPSTNLSTVLFFRRIIIND